MVVNGYTRVAQVFEPGEYAVRGDIIDVFPPDMQNPVRMEFFGDELDCAGTFDILTQRRTENVTDIVISPAKEFLLTEKSLSILFLTKKIFISNIKKYLQQR